MRVEKKCYSNNVIQSICTYLWKNNTFIGQKIEDKINNTIQYVIYLYESNEIVGFVYGDNEYLFVKNLQGDVTGVLKADDNSMVISMSYDGYGNVVYSNEYFQLSTELKSILNITYRGYFYDTETELYYLQSRYYDPKVGRFVNLDDASIAIITSSDILSCNLFAYCNNNPIVASDHTGLMRKDALNALAKGYYFKRDSYHLATSCLTSNTKNVYIAFHEIAQVIIGSVLCDKGYLVELEKKCSAGYIDVYGSKNHNKYIWEVKPVGGKSPEGQLKKYIKSTGYKRGGSLCERYIRVNISPKVFIQITFDGKGGAFYAFYYTKNGVRVTNKELSENLDLLKQYIKRIALTVFYTGIAAAGAAAIIGIIINTGGIAAPSLTQAAAALSGMLFNYYTATCFA